MTNNILLTLVFTLTTISCSDSSSGGGSSQSIKALTGVTAKTLDGSTYHSPNSTWWGYNMNKLVRKDNTVYYGVVEGGNEDGSINGDFAIYRIVDDGDPELLKTFPTSRPGNLLVGADGKLHVQTFVPKNVANNDSIGDLVVHTFAGLPTDTTTTTSVTAAASPDENTLLVNIRVGAAISGNVQTYGYGAAYNSDSVPAIITHNNSTGSYDNKNYTAFPDGEEDEYYYPFLVTNSNNDIHYLAVQDRYVPRDGGAVNFYHKMIYLFLNGSTDEYTFTTLVDYSDNEIVTSQDRLNVLEHSDLFLADDGKTHMVYKVRLDATEEYRTTDWVYQVRSTDGTFSTASISWAVTQEVNWLRFFEHEGTIYFFGCSRNKVFVAGLEDTSPTQIDLDISAIEGSYLYITAPRSGSDADSEYLDALFMEGNSTGYPNSKMRYFSIPRAQLTE